MKDFLNIICKPNIHYENQYEIAIVINSDELHYFKVELCKHKVELYKYKVELHDTNNSFTNKAVSNSKQHISHNYIDYLAHLSMSLTILSMSLTISIYAGYDIYAGFASLSIFRSKLTFTSNSLTRIKVTIPAPGRGGWEGKSLKKSFTLKHRLSTHYKHYKGFFIFYFNLYT